MKSLLYTTQFLLIFSFLFQFETVTAQTKEIDSLRLLLHQSPADTAEVKLLIRLANRFNNINLDSAEEYGVAAVSRGNELSGSEKMKAGAYSILGDVYFRKRAMDSAYHYYLKAKEVYETIGDRQALAQQLVNIANYYDSQSQYQLSLDNYFEAIDAYEEVKDTFHIELTYYNIGSTYDLMLEYDKAIEYYQKSLELADKIGDKDGVAWAYHGIAQLYVLQEEYKKAYSLYEKEIVIREQLGQIFHKVQALYYLSIAYQHANDFEPAKKQALAALALSRENAIDSYEGLILSLVGELESQLKHYEEAENYLDESLKFMPKQDTFAICHVYKVKALVLKGLGQYDDAVDLFEDVYGLAKKCKAVEIQIGTLKELYKMDSLQGNWLSALTRQSMYHHMKDSLDEKNDQERLQQLNVQFETQQKESEIENLKTLDQAKSDLIAATERQNLYLACFGGVSFVALILVGILYAQVNRNKRKIQEQNSNLEALNATKNRFFGIIAHDLRGPLTSLQGITDVLSYQIRKGKTDSLEKIAAQIETSTVKVNSLLDNLLKWALSQEGAMPYAPELLPLKTLVDENLRFFQEMADAKSIQLLTDLRHELCVYGDKETISTVIRNLISNAIKFTPLGGEIKITASRADEYVNLEVKDSGVGIPKEKLAGIFNLDDRKSTDGTAHEKGTGLGLTLVRDFVKMNHGKVDVQSDLDQGTSFFITLPADPTNSRLAS